MLYAPAEKGQGLVEYSLIIVLIAVLLVAAISLVVPPLKDMYSKIAAAFN